MNDERRTPPEVFEPLNRLFRFELDPATSKDNPLMVERWYTEQDDGLLQPWLALRCFVNPPYSSGSIVQWVEKARQEAKVGAFSALLLPADHSTKWYRAAKEASWGHWRVPFRVKYLLPDGSRDNCAKFPSIVFLVGGLP